MNKIIFILVLTMWGATVAKAQTDIEVTYDKTTHIIFPSAVQYADLGSSLLVAGKAEGAENVLRIKAATKDFSHETNMSVITTDGTFYTFNIRYSDNPQHTIIDMNDIIPNGKITDGVYVDDLPNESPKQVDLIMKSIYKDNKRKIKHIGSKNFQIQFLLRSLYIHHDLLYFHTQIKNSSAVSFDIDFITFKIVDKKVARRTAAQETTLEILRTYNYVTCIPGNTDEHTVFVLNRFTIPDDKQLIIELHERNGGRHQTFSVQNNDLIRAKSIMKLKAQGL